MAPFRAKRESGECCAGGGYFAIAARSHSLMNPYGSRGAAQAPSLDRLQGGAREALRRLHQLHDVSLQKGDREAARGVSAMLAQLHELDRRISRISTQ